MEINERLNVAGFNLYNDIYNSGDEQGTNEDIGHGETCHDMLLPTVGEIMTDEAESHKTEYPWVSADDLPQQFGMEVRGNLTNHRGACLHVAAAEENPAQAHEVESDDNGNDASPPGAVVVPVMVEHILREELMTTECQAVERTPEYEVPRSTMPQTTEQHRNEEVEIHPQLTLTIASE